jgi:phasin family protein
MNTKQVVNTYTDLTNKSVERINSLGELNLKLAETVTTRQMDVMNLFMEQGLRMMSLATEAKGYSDLYKGQVEMAKTISERMMDESKANMKLAGEIRDDYRGWFDAAMADVKDSSTVVRNAVTA